MYGVAVQIFEQLGLLIGIIIQSMGPKLIFKKLHVTQMEGYFFHLH